MGANEDKIVLSDYAQSLIRIKARQLCRRADFRATDVEDLHQELRLYLVKVAHHFDPQRAAMKTFIARAIDSCIKMILRDRRRDKRRTDLECISLEGTEINTSSGTVCLWSYIAQTEQTRRTGHTSLDALELSDLRDAIEQVMKHVSPDDRYVADLVAEHGKAGAARKRGVSRRQIDNALRRLRAQFADADLEEFGNGHF